MISLLSEHSLISTAIIFSVIAIFIWDQAVTREKTWEKRYPPIGEIVNIDGVRVHAIVTEVKGPDVVLIHGASGNARDMMLALGDELSARFRVIIIDRPGMGYTDRLTDESPEQQARLLQKAAAHFGAKKPIVVGHSYGGAVAAAWATYLPDTLAGMVNLAGATYPWQNGGVYFPYRVISTLPGQKLLTPILTALITEKQLQGISSGIFEPDPEPQGYFNVIGTPLIMRRQSLIANATQVNNLRQFLRIQSADYQNIRVPVEILHGQQDTIVPMATHSALMVRDVASARLTLLDGGHMIHHTHKEQIITAIERIAQSTSL